MGLWLVNRRHPLQTVQSRGGLRCRPKAGIPPTGLDGAGSCDGRYYTLGIAYFSGTTAPESGRPCREGTMRSFLKWVADIFCNDPNRILRESPWARKPKYVALVGTIVMALLAILLSLAKYPVN